MDEGRDGPYFPEFDMTPQERLEAAAEILLDAMREMWRKENRDKVRRCRARKKGQPASPEPAPEDESPKGGPTYRVVSCTDELPVTMVIERVDPPRKRRAQSAGYRRGSPQRAPKPEGKKTTPRFKIVPPGE